MSAQSASVAEIAMLLGVERDAIPAALAKQRISCVAAIDAAHPASLVFAQDAAMLSLAKLSPAGLILAAVADPADMRVLHVPDPRLAFAKVYARWFDRRGQAGIAASASIHPEAQVGDTCEVGEGVVIEAGVLIGRNCVIGPRVIIRTGTTLGDRVRIQSGTVLGSDGFGYAADAGKYLGFPQIGTLRIGDDVEIGANATVDRGALGETSIGRGTKIDNLVHIAHNCRIGEDVLIAAQVGIAGSTQVGNGAILGGQVGVGDRVVIGPGVIVGAQAGIPTSKHLIGAGKVFWGTPARPIKEYLRDLARLKRG